VVLSDVDPGAGTGGLLVAEGARRGRIGDVEADPRDQRSYSEITPLTPGEVYEWKIAVWPTARVFKAGHRIRIDISSSNFPRYDRNLNTGEGLGGTI
jgi:predicted acyl esterase